jgi:CHRD domain
MGSVRNVLAATVLGLVLLAPPARADQKPYSATLSAAEETPTPGPKGGTGSAHVTIDTTSNQLCYDLSWSKELGNPSGGHIHKGPKGVNGPIIVTFDLSKPKNCMAVDNIILMDIVNDPGGHYVNLHNHEYPNGAARGQLSAG